MQTLCTLVQTLCRYRADNHTRVQLAHFSVDVSGIIPPCALNLQDLRGRISAGYFPALLRVEKQEDQG
jgi:hypothetical protein